MTTLNEVAQQYGRTVNDAGQICKNGAPSGVTARMVKGGCSVVLRRPACCYSLAKAKARLLGS